MNRLLSVFISVIILGGCSQTSKPDGILSEDEMVKVLIDIQLTEGMVSALPISYDSSQMLYTLMEKDIFSKHGVEDSVFTKSMLFYLEDAAKMDRMYGRVIDSLTVIESTPGKKEELF